ncbi:hypothetical protein ACP4OV_023119 [Aristida adscensionis]
MAAYSALLSALVVVVVVSSGAGAAETALDQVCGGLGGDYITPAACVSALCADQAACRAAGDAHAVAALAARLAAANATAAKQSIQAYARSPPPNSPAAAEAARACLQLYAGVVPALQWAEQSVAAGRYPGAREVMQAALYVPGGCDGMAGDEVKLPSENGAFSMMAEVVHAVLASMSRA